jgi:hypothetical protein
MNNKNLEGATKGLDPWGLPPFKGERFEEKKSSDSAPNSINPERSLGNWAGGDENGFRDFDALVIQRSRRDLLHST